MRVFGILLQRRITRLEDHRQRLRPVADDPSGGTEIEQQRAPVGEQENVVRSNVAVKAVVVMNDLQRVEQRVDQGPQPVLGRGPGHLPQGLPEGNALVERHHHVCRAIPLPEAIHLDQRAVVELGEDSRFIDETAQTDGKGLGQACRLDGNRQTLDSRRQRGWHVLLQSDVASE
jgi:hypothetical protein